MAGEFYVNSRGIRGKFRRRQRQELAGHCLHHRASVDRPLPAVRGQPRLLRSLHEVRVLAWARHGPPVLQPNPGSRASRHGDQVWVRDFACRHQEPDRRAEGLRDRSQCVSGAEEALRVGIHCTGLRARVGVDVNVGSWCVGLGDYAGDGHAQRYLCVRSRCEYLPQSLGVSTSV